RGGKVMSCAPAGVASASQNRVSTSVARPAMRLFSDRVWVVRLWITRARSLGGRRGAGSDGRRSAAGGGPAAGSRSRVEGVEVDVRRGLRRLGGREQLHGLRAAMDGLGPDDRREGPQ